MVNTRYTSEKFLRRKRQSNPPDRRNLRFRLIGSIALLLIILLPSLQLNAQSIFRKYVVSGSLLFAAGCTDGMTETMKFHYEVFQEAFPNADTLFWDPSISWRNKYKNNDPEQGPKFFGSTTFLVGVTDSYHMSRTLRNSFVFGAIAFKIGAPKEKWYVYVCEFIGGGLIYKAGFWTTYEVIFHK